MCGIEPAMGGEWNEVRRCAPGISPTLRLGLLVSVLLHVLAGLGATLVWRDMAPRAVPGRMALRVVPPMEKPSVAPAHKTDDARPALARPVPDQPPPTKAVTPVDAMAYRPPALLSEIPDTVADLPARGYVVLRLRISAQGLVGYVGVEETDLPSETLGLLIEMFSAAHFSPAMREGQPEEGEMVLRIDVDTGGI